MFFDDGASPPKEVIAQWRDVVSSTFDPSQIPEDGDLPCIAVHCIAGLGRYHFVANIYSTVTFREYLKRASCSVLVAYYFGFLTLNFSFLTLLPILMLLHTGHQSL